MKHEQMIRYIKIRIESHGRQAEGRDEEANALLLDVDKARVEAGGHRKAIACLKETLALLESDQP